MDRPQTKRLDLPLIRTVTEDVFIFIQAVRLFYRAGNNNYHYLLSLFLTSEDCHLRVWRLARLGQGVGWSHPFFSEVVSSEAECSTVGCGRRPCPVCCQSI